MDNRGNTEPVLNRNHEDEWVGVSETWRPGDGTNSWIMREEGGDEVSVERESLLT